MPFFHIHEENISGVTRNINLRNIIGTSGPRLITFAIRTMTPDGAAGSMSHRILYEDEKNQQQIIPGGGITLTAVGPLAGGVDVVAATLMLDHHFHEGPLPHPLPYGLFGPDDNGQIEYELTLGGSAGSALFSYSILALATGDSSIYDIDGSVL